MTVDELKKKALQLNPESRAYLARELLASLDSMSDDETKDLWLDEERFVGMKNSTQGRHLLARQARFLDVPEQGENDPKGFNP